MTLQDKAAILTRVAAVNPDPHSRYLIDYNGINHVVFVSDIAVVIITLELTVELHTWVSKEMYHSNTIVQITADSYQKLISCDFF